MYMIYVIYMIYIYIYIKSTHVIASRKLPLSKRGKLTKTIAEIKFDTKQKMKMK